VSDRRYRGRHRPAREARLAPQLVGTALALPATATLAVITISGSPVHLDSSGLAAAGTTLAADNRAADEADLQDHKLADTTAARGVQDRVARDTERTRLDVVTAENTRRAQTEAALAANQDVVEVTTTGLPAVASTDAPSATADPAPAATAGSKAWVKPITASYVFTSGFAWRWGRMHNGQDIAVPTGTPVRALSTGTVIFAGWQPSYGYKVEIEYWDGTVSYYGHNSRVLVRKGQQVAPGQVVAMSGNTGNSTGPHLHLEIRPDGGNPVSPIPWLARHGVKM